MSDSKNKFDSAELYERKNYSSGSSSSKGPLFIFEIFFIFAGLFILIGLTVKTLDPIFAGCYFSGLGFIILRHQYRSLNGIVLGVITVLIGGVIGFYPHIDFAKIGITQERVWIAIDIGSLVLSYFILTATARSRKNAIKRCTLKTTAEIFDFEKNSDPESGRYIAFMEFKVNGQIYTINRILNRPPRIGENVNICVNPSDPMDYYFPQKGTSSNTKFQMYLLIVMFITLVSLIRRLIFLFSH